MGFGPRYLHSTGQLHKGGPPTGVFLQVLADEPADLPIPGRSYGFRALIDAQAAGDARGCATPDDPSRACASGSSRPLSTPPSGGSREHRPSAAGQPAAGRHPAGQRAEPLRRRHLRRHGRPGRPQARAGALQPRTCAACCRPASSCWGWAARDVAATTGCATMLRAETEEHSRTPVDGRRVERLRRSRWATSRAIRRRGDVRRPAAAAGRSSPTHGRQPPLLPLDAAVAVPVIVARSRRGGPVVRAAATAPGCASSSRSRSGTT